MSHQGWALEVQRLGRLKGLFPGYRIERVLSPARVVEFTAVSLDSGSRVSALTVASLERKLHSRARARPRTALNNGTIPGVSAGSVFDDLG